MQATIVTLRTCLSLGLLTCMLEEFIKKEFIICMYDVDAEALNSVVNFGINTGDIWLENVQCFGSEEVLVDCSFSARVSPNCTHQEDIGVRCQPQQSEFRRCSYCRSLIIWKLVSGMVWGKKEGRREGGLGVEYLGGIWGGG